MINARAHRLVAVVAFGLWGAAAHAQPAPSAQPPPRCALVITPSVAQRFYESLRRQPPREGCVLDAVTTAKSRITVSWTQNGAALPAVTVEPYGCAPARSPKVGSYGVQTPPEFARACPGAAQQLRALLEDGSVEPTLVGTAARGRRSYRGVFAVLAVALFVGLWVRDALRRRAKPAA